MALWIFKIIFLKMLYCMYIIKILLRHNGLIVTDLQVILSVVCFCFTVNSILKALYLVLLLFDNISINFLPC